MGTRFYRGEIMRYFKLADRLHVVEQIINGELLVEEAMEIYGIKARITVIRWLIAYSEKVKATKNNFGF